MNHAKIEQFVGVVVNDMAAGLSTAMTNLGHRLGLYKSMAGAGRVTAGELARLTGMNERYVREWLNNQAAGGYVAYHPGDQSYELPDEHATVLADENSSVFMAGGLGVIATTWLDEDKIADAFRTGRGIGWHEHDSRLFASTESFYRTGYRANLTTTWIPALDGVESKLKQGAKVADVGCGHGASAILMAQAYPASMFWGFDYHPESIATARLRASDANLSNRVQFEAATAKNYGGTGYDLICFMDCLHDLGDPIGAAEHARRALADDGTVLVVEPRAGDSVQENLNPVGRLFYAASTAICTPNSLSQEVGEGLGAQAGEARIREIFQAAGFGRFRRVAETPFNIVLEARK
jgi:SAM-dependent methyltransferase